MGANGSTPRAMPQATSSRTTRFQAFADTFTSIEQVQQALRREGLESSNLIVAIDFTKSNEWTGKRSFQGRSLHALGNQPNPYETAVSVIGKTLEAFDDDNLIPVYGFGDGSTSDKHVFSLLPGDQPCQGLQHVLWRYKEVAPYIRLAGPTSFAPAIQQATQLVARSGGQYHILLLIADGQVTRSSDMGIKDLSPQERATVDAIVTASKFPLSIIMVGVGDGPWDMMKQFDDMLPSRAFDNFQFVNLTEAMAQTSGNPQRLETVFALRALMEVPQQYKAIKQLGILGRCPSYSSPARVLPPPQSAPPPASHGSFHGAPAYGSQAGAPLPGGYPGPAGQPPPHMMQQQQQPPPQGYPPMYGQAPPAAGGMYPVHQQYGSQHYPLQQPAAGQPPSAGASAPAAGSSEAPQMFVCPISHEVMSDPVLAKDGYTYDRASITQWFRSHNTSPMTNAPLSSKELVPNHSLRSAILEAQQQGRIPRE